jgi:hypothetical protein
LPLDTTFLARYLGGVDASEFPTLETLLEGVTSFVEGETNRRFRASASITEYLDGNGDAALELRTPVASGNPSITLNWGGSWSTTPLVPTTDFYIDRHPTLGISNVAVLTMTRWPLGLRNVKAVYSGGYGTSGLNPPAEIATLIADIVGLRYRARVGSTQAPTDELPKHLQVALDRWKYVETAVQTRLVRA